MAELPPGTPKVLVQLSSAADDLAPNLSAKRATEAAQWVLTTVAVIASIGTGFGLIQAEDTVSSSWAARVAFTLAVAAVVVALLSLAGFPRRVNPAVLTQVSRYYSQLIVIRAGGAAVATLLLAAAAVMAGVAVWISSPSPEVSLTVNWDLSSPQPVLEMSAVGTHLPSDERITVVLQQGSGAARAGQTTRVRRIATWVVPKTSSGAASVSAKIGQSGARRLRAGVSYTAVVRIGPRVLERITTVAPRPLVANTGK